MVAIAAHLSEAAILQVQERVRRRVLKAFVRWGLLEAGARDEKMLAWQHGGGFSLDAAVHIAADFSLPGTARAGDVRPNGRDRSDPSGTGVPSIRGGGRGTSPLVLLASPRFPYLVLALRRRDFLWG